MPEKSYKPMNKCPNCGMRGDTAVIEISEDGKTYTLLCDCGRRSAMPQAQVKLGIFVFNSRQTLIGYFHWSKDEDIFPPAGTRIDWDTLQVI